MNKPSVLCEFGEVHDNSIFCKQVNDNCGFVRWCTTAECVKNSDGYKTCVVRTKNMSKQKETKKNIEIIESELIEENKDDLFIEDYCTVLWKKDHSFGIDFLGYGVSFHTKDDNYLDTSFVGNTIKVKYKNIIGSPDFEIHPVYE